MVMFAEVGEAVKTVAEIMRSSDSDSLKLQSARTILSYTLGKNVNHTITQNEQGLALQLKNEIEQQYPDKEELYAKYVEGRDARQRALEAKEAMENEADSES